MLQGLMRRKHAIAEAESARIRQNLARHDVELMEGHARFVGPHAVEVTARDGSTRTLNAKVVLVATGTKPRQPADIDFASPLIHDSDEVLLAGATVDLFIEMVFNFPTLAESYKYAAYACLAQLATEPTAQA
jgi:pyruvate/2-oxoglutarate dehydrogenase complex dihydrolipoamide dehydrogenase (E3) component